MSDYEDYAIAREGLDDAREASTSTIAVWIDKDEYDHRTMTVKNRSDKVPSIIEVTMPVSLYNTMFPHHAV